jgi:hypothetical protein
MESAQPEIWTLFPQNAAVPAVFHALSAAPADSIITMVDGVAMVTREAIDRLQQIIAQSWYWIGGFCAPSDRDKRRLQTSCHCRACWLNTPQTDNHNAARLSKSIPSDRNDKRFRW